MSKENVLKNIKYKNFFEIEELTNSINESIKKDDFLYIYKLFSVDFFNFIAENQSKINLLSLAIKNESELYLILFLLLRLKPNNEKLLLHYCLNSKSPSHYLLWLIKAGFKIKISKNDFSLLGNKPYITSLLKTNGFDFTEIDDLNSTQKFDYQNLKSSISTNSLGFDLDPNNDNNLSHDYLNHDYLNHDHVIGGGFHISSLLKISEKDFFDKIKKGMFWAKNSAKELDLQALNITDVLFRNLEKYKKEVVYYQKIAKYDSIPDNNDTEILFNMQDVLNFKTKLSSNKELEGRLGNIIEILENGPESLKQESLKQESLAPDILDSESLKANSPQNFDKSNSLTEKFSLEDSSKKIVYAEKIKSDSLLVFMYNNISYTMDINKNISPATGFNVCPQSEINSLLKFAEVYYENNYNFFHDHSSKKLQKLSQNLDFSNSDPLIQDPENNKTVTETEMSGSNTDPDLTDPDLDDQHILVQSENIQTEIKNAPPIKPNFRKLALIDDNTIKELDKLSIKYVNFKKVIEYIKKTILLSMRGNNVFFLPPILLNGPPGIGKTMFVKSLAKIIKTDFNFVSMNNTSASFVLTGSSNQWGNSNYGAIFETLVFNSYKNPIIFLDEIDKPGDRSSNDIYAGGYGIIKSLLNLFEVETAKHFVDEFIKIKIDASKIIWFLTSNEINEISKVLLNRLKVFDLEKPTIDELKIIAKSIYHDFINENSWGKSFQETPTDSYIDYLSNLNLSPRELKIIIFDSFMNASVKNNTCLTIEDVELLKKNESYSKIGFLSALN